MQHGRRYSETKDEGKFQRALDELFEYCDGCGSQRCYGQDEMIEGCYHYKLLVKENEQLRRKK